jgi:regulatory protein
LHKLISKQFDEETIHAVLAALTHEGVLSDKRFTESFIHYRRERGLGPLRIQAELKDRGITDALIEQHLEIAALCWTMKARLVWQKRFKNHIPSDYKTRFQQMRFLQYRGFTHEQINSIFYSDDNV